MLDTLLFYTMKTLPVFLCLFLAFLSFPLYFSRKNNSKVNWKLLLIQYVFTAYLVLVLSIVGVTSLLFFLQNPPYFKVSNMDVNLMPFVNLRSDLRQYLANIFLFVPFGLLFPFLNPEKNLLSTFLWGIGFSFSIEFLQIFSLRTSDINDLLMNGLGVLLGYLLLAFIQKIRFHAKLRPFPMISLEQKRKENTISCSHTDFCFSMISSQC